jgi:hypothetical protein
LFAVNSRGEDAFTVLDERRHNLAQLFYRFSRPEDDFGKPAPPAAVEIDRRGQGGGIVRFHLRLNSCESKCAVIGRPLCPLGRVRRQKLRRNGEEPVNSPPAKGEFIDRAHGSAKIKGWSCAIFNYCSMRSRLAT